MIHMQETDLVVFLPQHNEDGVQEFNQLGEIVPPQYFCYLSMQNVTFSVQVKCNNIYMTMTYSQSVICIITVFDVYLEYY